MDERFYRFLKYTAMAMAIAWISWTLYDGFIKGKDSTVLALEAGNRYFADGLYEEALAEFDNLLKSDPNNLHALRGIARSLLQLGRYDEALETYDRLVSMDPDFGASYANRGILNDRIGRYEQAIADYEKALSLNEELAAGPNWLTRFLRNQPKQQATIAQRAAYLREQLAKPENERLMRVPELDAQQRAYNQ